MKILDTPRSGSVAGVTSSRNRFGQYYRTRAIPVQPRTPKQTNTRSYFTTGSSGWRTLTDPQRTAWNDYAAQITRSDRLGSGYSPTGAALYTGASVMNGGSGLTDPPSSLPDYVLTVNGMLYTDPTPGPEAFVAQISVTSTTNLVIIETSGPVSPGITSSAAVRSWRSLPVSSDNRSPRQYPMTSANVNILMQYKFLFPSPVVGQTIWFRFRELFFDGVNAAGVTNRSLITFRFVVV